MPHTHLHYGDNKEKYIFIGNKKGYDEFAYDAFIGILGGIASWKYGVDRIDEKYLQTLVRRGQKNGDAYYAVTPVKELRSNFEPYAKGTVVQIPSFDEFIEKHGDYLKLMLLGEILSKSPKRLPKDEEKKIERTIEIAIDAAKKLAEVYGNPEKLVHVGLMKIKHAKDALGILEFLNPEKHPLDVIGDHIIELKKMHPEVVKPEKVYGEEWFEFLKEKGVDTKEFRRGAKKIKKTRDEDIAGIPENAKLEVLSILHGLEFAGFSDEAKQKAIERLSSRIAEVSAEKLTPGNLQKLGLYAFAIEMIKSGNFERLGEIEKL
ncbi:hypothetical protein [Thermococcus sp.]